MDPLFDTPYNPLNTKTGGQSFASRPGLIPLSTARLRRFHPEIYTVRPWMFWLRSRYQRDELFKTHVHEHMRYGLAEAAIVVQLQPLILACYAEELDAVMHLGFYNSAKEHPREVDTYPKGLADELIQLHDLQVGRRLLAVNTFELFDEHGYAIDLIPGPKARGVYQNFSPYIAEFLTADASRVEEQKQLVEEYEWERCQKLSHEYCRRMHKGIIRPRDGRPMTTVQSLRQPWRPEYIPQHVLDWAQRKGISLS